MIQKESVINLKDIIKSDFKFLFILLKERDSRANISHKKIPTYKKHVEFIESKPYSKWYIIYHKNKKVGSVYLSKQDEIGIFIKKNMKQKGIGHDAIQVLMKLNPRERYLANISPKNITSMKFFQKHNFELIQYTYQLTT